jgi:hypothetical protein
MISTDRSSYMSNTVPEIGGDLADALIGMTLDLTTDIMNDFQQILDEIEEDSEK